MFFLDSPGSNPRSGRKRREIPILETEKNGSVDSERMLKRDVKNGIRSVACSFASDHRVVNSCRQWSPNSSTHECEFAGAFKSHARSSFLTSAVHTNSFPVILNSLISPSRCGLPAFLLFWYVETGKVAKSRQAFGFRGELNTQGSVRF